MENRIEKLSFILGMTTAFGECVACEAKYLALSPPMTRAQAQAVKGDMEHIAEGMGLRLHYEDNPDLDQDVVWWVIYKFDDQLGSYLSLRQRGLNPWKSMDAFRPLLSYGMVYGDGAEGVVPKMKVPANPMGVVSEILEI